MEAQWQAIPLKHSPKLSAFARPLNKSFRPRTPFFLIKRPCPIFKLDHSLPARGVECGKKIKKFFEKNARKRTVRLRAF
jgi:hypothetical protein